MSFFGCCCGGGAAPVATAVPNPPAFTTPVPPGLPVPPTIPFENPADATVPRSCPPGTPFATPEPKFVPPTAPLRAAPAPTSVVPGAPPKVPSIGASNLPSRALGFAFAPIGSPNPPTWGDGVLLLFATTVGLGLAKTPTFACRGGATAFGGAAGTIGIGVGTFAMTGFGGSTSTGGLIFGGS